MNCSFFSRVSTVGRIKSVLSLGVCVRLLALSLLNRLAIESWSDVQRSLVFSVTSIQWHGLVSKDLGQLRLGCIRKKPNYGISTNECSLSQFWKLRQTGCYKIESLITHCVADNTLSGRSFINSNGSFGILNSQLNDISVSSHAFSFRDWLPGTDLTDNYA